MEYAPVSLDELVEQMDSLKKQFQNDGQFLFKQALEQFYTDHTVVKSIQFAGWVPYFNDGDECRFGVMEHMIKVNDFSDDDFYDIKYGNTEETEEYKAFSDLTDLIHKVPREIFQDMFGNHFLVTATPEKIDIEEYTDHE